MPSEKTFNDYDWDAIADAIGTKVLARQSDNVEIRARRGQRGPGGVEVLSIIIAENGGELNIFAVVPLVSESVPYWSNAHPGGAVGDMTLASRLTRWRLIFSRVGTRQRSVPTKSATDAKRSDPGRSQLAVASRGIEGFVEGDVKTVFHGEARVDGGGGL